MRIVQGGGSYGRGKVPLVAGRITDFASALPSGRSTASPLGVTVMVDPAAPSGSYTYVAPDSGLASPNGVKLAPGDSYLFAVTDVSRLFAVADTDAVYLAWEAPNDA